MKRALLAVLCAFVAGLALAQALEPRVYMPAIYGGQAVTPTPLPPAPTPTPAPHGAVWVADVVMPFNVLGGVEPIGVQDATGVWFVNVYRIDSGDNNGEWVVTFRDGDPVARAIGQVGEGPPVAVQDVPLTNARGSLARSYDGQRLYSIAWHDTQGGSRRPKLRLHRVLDYVP